MVEQVAGNMGLQLNHSKSEIICVDPTTRQSMFDAFPDFCVVSQDHATLLGSPIGNSVEGTNDAISAKISALAVMGSGSACSMRMMHFASSKMLSPYPRCSTLCKLPLVFYRRSSRASMIYRDLCWQTFPTSPLMPMIQPGPKLFSQWGLEGWGSGVLLSLHLLPFWPLLLVPPSSPVRSSHLVYRRHRALLMVWPLLSGVVGVKGLSPLCRICHIQVW